MSQKAVYVGLVEEDRTTGLGLYRYRFDTQEWDLLAWGGFRIPGITVWGEADENILLIRYGAPGPVRVYRSTDSGQTWVATIEWPFKHHGLTQAPSDTSRMLIHDPAMYSSDAGWSWHLADGSGGVEARGLCIDPSNPQVSYLTGDTPVEVDVIHKSTDGGASWHWAFVDGVEKWGIAVALENTENVMCATTGNMIDVTTDAGEAWSVIEAPFLAKELACPRWSPRTFYAAGSNGGQLGYEVWRTEDLGQTWFPCGDNLPDLPGTALRSTNIFLECHPTEPVLYAALEGSGVWRWDVSASGAPDDEASSHPEIRLLLYPNPSMDRFTYGMDLPRPDHAVLSLHDVNGRLLRTLKDGFFPSGTHVFRWDDSETGDPSMPSGVYYLKLDAGEVHEQRKAVLLR